MAALACATGCLVTGHFLFGRVGKIGDEREENIRIAVADKVMFDLAEQERRILFRAEHAGDDHHRSIFLRERRCSEIQLGKRARRDDGHHQPVDDLDRHGGERQEGEKRPQEKLKEVCSGLKCDREKISRSAEGSGRAMLPRYKPWRVFWMKRISAVENAGGN